MRRRTSRASRSPLLLAGLVALALAAGAAAGGPAVAKSGSPTLATLKITADQVTVKLKGKPSFTAATDGMVLHQGDSIKTDEAGRAEIDYTDGSLTRLGASTYFTISKLTNDRGGRQTQGTLSVGETWNRAAKVSETGSFEVKAGGTTAAVEGTAFVVACPQASGQGSGQVSCSVTAVVDNVNVSSDVWDVTSTTTP